MAGHYSDATCFSWPMRHFPWFCHSLSAGTFTALLILAASAQAEPRLHAAADSTDGQGNGVTENGVTDNTAQALATAADLRITPRISADYNSPQAGDTSLGYSRLNAFIPVIQTPGQSLTFLNTSVRLDTQNRMGANVAIGHRFLENDLLWGGYLAYDIRNTSLGTFNQLGAGIEVYGTNWDAHLNGYLPIGTSSATSGSLVTGTSFQGSQLLLSTGATSQAAQGGADVEAGLKLANLGQWGNLWGYGGTYWYGDNLGARLRLEQRSLNAINVGVGLDTGGLGTNVFASIGVGWGGAPRRSATAVTDAETSDDTADNTALKQNSDETPTDRTTPGNGTSGDAGFNFLQAIWSRGANGPSRNFSIVIEEEVVPTGTEVAVNPDTGQPYVIRHVTPNSGNPNQGDGSFENPYTTLGEADSDTDNTGLRNVTSGEIIYVQAGDSRTNNLDPFAIPAGVQVYSEAVAQTLNTSLGQFTLPNSGTGIRPLVDGGGTNVGITLTGGNNLISGFEVTNSTSGISSNNSANSIIQNNIVSGGSNHGILVQNQSGVTISDNQITNTTPQFSTTIPPAAISLSEVTGTVLIDSNTITGTNVGMVALLQPVEGIGIGLLNTNAGIINVTVSNNIVTGNEGDGVAIGLGGATNATIGNFTITNNTIQTNGGTTGDVRGDGIKINSGGNSQVASLLIEGNTISNNRDDGIDISVNQSPPAPGAPDTGTASIDNVIIRNNNITNSSTGPGILLRTFNASSMTITVENNTLDNNNGTGLTATTADTSHLCLTLTNNNSSNGYSLTAGAGTMFDAISTGNTGNITTAGTITSTGAACP